VTKQQPPEELFLFLAVDLNYRRLELHYRSQAVARIFPDDPCSPIKI
jgi:hypothetical protein